MLTDTHQTQLFSMYSRYAPYKVLTVLEVAERHLDLRLLGLVAAWLQGSGQWMSLCEMRFRTSERGWVHQYFGNRCDKYSMRERRYISSQLKDEFVCRVPISD